MNANLRTSSSATGKKNFFDRTVDFVATYGGVSGGSQATNDAALSAFNSAYAGFTGRTKLIVPPGDFDFLGGGFGSSGGTGLMISAYGATLRNLGGFGAAGQYGDTVHHALIQTISAGNDTVLLVTSGQTSRFSVGQWVIVTEGDVQGYGQPTNPWKFEFKKILSIGTGSLTFTEPLSKSYRSTYPNYNPGTVGIEPYAGGPATVYALNPAWDQAIEMRGGYIADNGNLFYGRGRDISYVDMFFETYGPAASQNIKCGVHRCTVGTFGEMEVDKLVETLVLKDNLFNAIVFQSTGINNLIADNNATRSGQYWRGVGGGRSVISNLTTDTFWYGLFAYGVALGETTLIDCNAAAASYNTSYRFALADYGQPGGGALTITSNDVQRWAVPDGWCVLLDGSGHFSGISFQVTDVAFSGGVTTISTTLSTPVPGTSGGFSAPWYIHPHPGKNTTHINCTGNSTFTSMSGQPANSPVFGW